MRGEKSRRNDVQIVIGEGRGEGREGGRREGEIVGVGGKFMDGRHRYSCTS